MPYPYEQTKICTDCGTAKAVEDFHRTNNTGLAGGGRQPYCKACSSRRNKNNLLLKQYGITLEQYEGLLAVQEYACALCRQPEADSSKPLTLDYEESTGKVKALLCAGCYTALSYFGFDPDRINSALMYATSSDINKLELFISEDKRTSTGRTPLTEAEKLRTAADEVFLVWKSTFEDRASSRFTPARRRKVEARLRAGDTLDRLKKAIRGCKLSPFHNGINESGTVYNDLELICRSDEKVENFCRIADREDRREAAVESLRRRDALRMISPQNCAYCREAQESRGTRSCPVHKNKTEGGGNR